MTCWDPGQEISPFPQGYQILWDKEMKIVVVGSSARRQDPVRLGGVSAPLQLCLSSFHWDFIPSFSVERRKGERGEGGGHRELISLGSAQEKTLLKWVIPGLEISSEL